MTRTWWFGRLGVHVGVGEPGARLWDWTDSKWRRRVHWLHIGTVRTTYDKTALQIVVGPVMVMGVWL